METFLFWTGAIFWLFIIICGLVATIETIADAFGSTKSQTAEQVGQEVFIGKAMKKRLRKGK